MITRAIIGIILGYITGAAVGAALLGLVSNNTHDKPQEIVMTAAFATGPLGAVVGGLAALVLWWRPNTR